MDLRQEDQELDCKKSILKRFHARHVDLQMNKNEEIVIYFVDTLAFPALTTLHA